MSLRRLPGADRPVVVQPTFDPGVTYDVSRCDHAALHVTVDRRVVCRECGETVDPVDALLCVARSWERLTILLHHVG